MDRRRLVVVAALAALAVPSPASARQDFVNWETPHVHPLALSPDRTRLAAVDTPAGTVELFDATSPTPVHVATIPVGVDPVSARFRDDGELWVVNHVSDSVSVVDVAAGAVVASLRTADEPCDVVFAGAPERAFVSCSQANTVQVFDPANLGAAPLEVPLAGEDPRALAVSPDGSSVHVAIFESGNATTILGGGDGDEGFRNWPPMVVSDPTGPYGGQNPPPNSGGSFDPPLSPGLPAPPRVGLIVKKDASGTWHDDNGGDWTALVSGPEAHRSGRPVGWDLPDRDVATIDADSLAVTYARGLMNADMALAVNPESGRLAVVGTDATNWVRFEPVLNGRFLRVVVAFVDPDDPASAVVHDLNGHLDYSAPSTTPELRARSVGDPRAVVWTADGRRAWIAGMGSNNLVVVDGTGVRVGAAPTVEVGEGPTGLALDEAAGRLYVLNKFESSLSVVDLATQLEAARVPFFDPSPAALREGRKHLYDTRATSGLGHLSCASCHIDARTDKLAWDLGNPAGQLRSFTGNCPDERCEDWHPMKGPMLTQTLQDIIGKEPLHWRGDKLGIEEFNSAFTGLQGRGAELTPQEMQALEDFLATIHVPPNPYRGLDNSLPRDLPLTGLVSTGRFSPVGTPLPNGDAVDGLEAFRFPNILDRGAACGTCHTVPTGLGANFTMEGGVIPPGPDGERHHKLVSLVDTTNKTMKVPQLRTLFERIGFDATTTDNTSGFGFLHDGSVDSLVRFLSMPFFNVATEQELSDLTALMLSFSGSGMAQGTQTNFFDQLGPTSLDTHAAVGRQSTLRDGAAPAPGQLALLDQLKGLAGSGAIGLVVHGRFGGEARGFQYLGGGQYRSDRAGQSVSDAQLRAAAAPGAELTWTAVPAGSERRLGIDRDRDGFLDRDELDQGSDPSDPDSRPGDAIVPVCFGGVACPCGNAGAAGAGCANSQTLGAILGAEGSASVGADDLVLRAVNARASQTGVFLQGASEIAQPFKDGVLCVGDPTLRLEFTSTDALGSASSSVAVAAAGGALPGSALVYQLWYRDPGGPCAQGSNLSNGLRVEWQ